MSEFCDDCKWRNCCDKSGQLVWRADHTRGDPILGDAELRTALATTEATLAALIEKLERDVVPFLDADPHLQRCAQMHIDSAKGLDVED